MSNPVWIVVGLLVVVNALLFRNLYVHDKLVEENQALRAWNAQLHENLVTERAEHLARAVKVAVRVLPSLSARPS